MKPTHIWFDLEGTLLANPIYEKAVSAFVYQLYADVLGKPLNEELKKKFDISLQQKKRRSFVFMELGKPAGFYCQKFMEDFPFQKYIFPDKDVQEVISYLKNKRIYLGVFTSLPRQVLVETLYLLGLQATDFMLLSGDDVVNGKPHPEGFERIIQLSRVPAKQIIFIGDSEFKDIIPAKGVGMKTILVRSKNKSDVADYSCGDFKGLLEIIKRLLQ